MIDKIHTIIPAEPGTYLLHGDWVDYIKEPVIAWACAVGEGGGIITNPVTVDNNQGRTFSGDTLLLFRDGQVARLDGNESWDNMESHISCEQMQEEYREKANKEDAE